MENKLISIENKNKITSLELLEQINLFREKEDKTELQHYDLLKIIRDEFEEEIGLGKISVSSYKNSQNKEQPMYNLTFNQARQVLARESKIVRKAVFLYIEKLQEQIDFNKEQKLLAYDEMATENKKLRYDNGNGENLKAINYIDWIKEYFYREKTNFVLNIWRELAKLSNEKQIPYDSITNQVFGSGEVYVFHEVIYDIFKERLDNDKEHKILTNYRKFR